MKVEHHDLHHEFPGLRSEIRDLKMNNRYFSRRFDEYHDLDREIRKIEEETEVSSEGRLDLLKKQRLAIKDELYNMLKNAG